MLDKKKATISRATASKMPDRRVTNLEAPKNQKNQEGGRGTVAVRATNNSDSQPSSQKQLASFESAMKQFHARRFKEARDLFHAATQGPERDIAHRARLHATICEGRLERAPVNLQTAEEHYNYGIALLNTRKIDDARSHLEQALALAPEADHVFYALAAAQALSGDAAGAHEHLKRAIELDPKNRLMARQDGDFAALSSQTAFQTLLYPEKKSW
jgi:tetratricopeptide (TPR) repeat protein